MSEQSDGHERKATEQTRKDIILEFCRSHGAPSADWLGRLSTNGQRECIRQWILRVTSPEITSLLPAVAEELYAQDERPGLAERDYEEGVRQGVFPPEDVYPEGRKEYSEERIEADKYFVDEQLKEKLRYGAVGFEGLGPANPTNPLVKKWQFNKCVRLRQKRYRKYRNLCDQEWQRMVEGKQAARDNLHRVLLATLLVVATALISGKLYVAMWCAVIGGLVTTFLVWPRRGSNLNTSEAALDRALKQSRKGGPLNPK
jgi:hypothetical protein